MPVLARVVPVINPAIIAAGEAELDRLEREDAPPEIEVAAEQISQEDLRNAALAAEERVQDLERDLSSEVGFLDEDVELLKRSLAATELEAVRADRKAGRFPDVPPLVHQAWPVPTPGEIERVLEACHMAGVEAFRRRGEIRPGDAAELARLGRVVHEPAPMVTAERRELAVRVLGEACRAHGCTMVIFRRDVFERMPAAFGEHRRRVWRWARGWTGPGGERVSMPEISAACGAPYSTVAMALREGRSL